MRILVLACLLATCCCAENTVLAQSAEIKTPDVEIMPGVAAVSAEDNGKLAFHFAAGAPVTYTLEMVTQTYTVMVPYTEQVERDGKMVPVTRTRAEERTRDVTVTRQQVLTDFAHAWDDLEILTLHGDEVSVEDAKVHFETKQPIVAIYEGAELSEFYTHVLQDEILVVVLPRPDGEGVLVPAPGVELPRRPRRR